MKNIIFYLTLNFPNKDEFFKLLDILDGKGVENIEIGIPVDNPFMDGPVIQYTHQEVIKFGIGKDDIQSTLQKIRKKYNFKIFLMTYFEGIKKYNLTSFDYLYDGLLCVNQKLTRNDTRVPVQIYPPDIEKKEMEQLLQNNEGFAYVISGNGKTGSFNEVPKEYVENMSFIKENSNLPVYIGFGIKTSEDVREVLKSGADGVIIGTALLTVYVEEGLDGVESYLKTFQIKTDSD